MWSQCKHCHFKVQEREVVKYSCHAVFTMLITIVPSDWPNAERGVKWPWCHSRPALPCGRVYRIQPLWATGKAPVLGGKREWCCPIKVMGKEAELQRIASNSPFFTIVGFSWFWVGFFFPSGSQNWNAPRGDWNQIAICVPLPSCFFLFFSCRRTDLLSNLGISQFLPDLKPRHIAAVGLPANCQEEGCCKGKGTFLLNSSCSFEYNLCSRH